MRGQTTTSLNANANVQKSMVVDAIAADPAIRLRLQQILHMALDNMEQILTYGTESNKINVMRALMPGIVASFRASDESDVLKELRGDIDGMFKELSQSSDARKLPSDNDDEPEPGLDSPQ